MGQPRFHRNATVLLSCSALLLGILAAALSILAPDLYVHLAREDHFGESLTAFNYLLAAVALITPSLRWMARGRPATREVLPLLLALFFVFVAGEEISWGQRIFGFETPELLANFANRQGEVNLHNLKWFNSEEALIDQYVILNAFALVMGVVVPVSARYSKRFSALYARLNFPVFSPALAMFFVVGVGYAEAMNAHAHSWMHSELRELLLSLAFLLAALFRFNSMWSPQRD